MKEKSLAILICIVIALSILGFTYAQWNDTITISATMQFGQWSNSLNMGFVQPLTCSDNENTKNVGECDCHYADRKIDSETGMDAYNTTIIIINNGYPGYEVYCNFTLKNIGTLTPHINKMVISDPTNALTWDNTLSALVDADGKPILNIGIIPEDLVCNELSSGETLEAEINVSITQNAKQCHTYYLQVGIAYEEAQT